MKMFDYFWENFLRNMILDWCLFLEVCNQSVIFLSR